VERKKKITAPITRSMREKGRRRLKRGESRKKKERILHLYQQQGRYGPLSVVITVLGNVEREEKESPICFLPWKIRTGGSRESRRKKKTKYYFLLLYTGSARFRENRMKRRRRRRGTTFSPSLTHIRSKRRRIARLEDGQRKKRARSSSSLLSQF